MTVSPRSRRTAWVIGAVGLAGWVALRGRRRAREATLSLPTRTVERGKDAAGVVTETAAELLTPPGSEGPLA